MVIFLFCTIFYFRQDSQAERQARQAERQARQAERQAERQEREAEREADRIAHETTIREKNELRVKLEELQTRVSKEKQHKEEEEVRNQSKGKSYFLICEIFLFHY